MDPLTVVLVLLIVGAAAWERHRQACAFQAERDTWRDERQVLLERIQRPDIPPQLQHVPPRHTTEEDKQRAAEALARQAALASVGTARPLKVGGEG